MKALGRPLRIDETEHLLRRIAFAPRLSEAEHFVSQGATASEIVSKSLGNTDSEPSPESRAVLDSVRQLNQRDLLAGAWLLQIQESKTPLRESLTLFWHNHFVSALSKVRESAMMQDQIESFFRLGIGSFSTLTHETAKSAAMIRYLDLERSTKSAPNENFARELLELFTTGQGPYTERDIKEAARAFTGYHLRGGRFHFSPASADLGKKTVLGKTGPWSGEDVVKICAEHSATARFISEKLARHFVCDAPDAPLIDAISARFIQRKGVIRLVLQDLFSSELFFAPRYRFVLTKSPVALVMGTLRLLGRNLPPAQLARTVQAMGQNLCDAPSVEGYRGGESWLNPATHLARREFLLTLAHEWESMAERNKTVPLPSDTQDLCHAVLGFEIGPKAYKLIEKTHAKEPKAVLSLLLCHPGFQRS